MSIIHCNLSLYEDQQMGAVNQALKALGFGLDMCVGCKPFQNDRPHVLVADTLCTPYTTEIGTAIAPIQDTLQKFFTFATDQIHNKDLQHTDIILIPAQLYPVGETPRGCLVFNQDNRETKKLRAQGVVSDTDLYCHHAILLPIDLPLLQREPDMHLQKSLASLAHEIGEVVMGPDNGPCPAAANIAQEYDCDRIGTALLRQFDDGRYADAAYKTYQAYSENEDYVLLGSDHPTFQERAARLSTLLKFKRDR